MYIFAEKHFKFNCFKLNTKRNDGITKLDATINLSFNSMINELNSNFRISIWKYSTLKFIRISHQNARDHTEL